MKVITLTLIGAVLCASSLVAADRLTDKDVKALVDRLDEGRSRFKDALDDKIKKEILRGPSGEVDVDKFLDDFKDKIERLKDRIKPEYAASAEAQAVLHQASQINNFFRQQPPGTKGESEWNRMAGDLKTLATAYGTSFPLPENAPVRRLGDREVASALESLSKSAGGMKKTLDDELKKDATVDKPTRESMVSAVEDLSKDAKELRSRVNDGKPSSAEAEALLSHATAFESTLSARQVPGAKSMWTGPLAKQLETVATAYRLPWPATK
jgi:archaellum component FlaC